MALLLESHQQYRFLDKVASIILGDCNILSSELGHNNSFLVVDKLIELYCINDSSNQKVISDFITLFNCEGLRTVASSKHTLTHNGGVIILGQFTTHYSAQSEWGQLPNL